MKLSNFKGAVFLLAGLVAGLIALVLASASTVALADVPAATSGGVFSDGQSEFTAFNASDSSVSIYRSMTGQQVGQTVEVPDDPENDNEPDDWTVVGVTGDLIYLIGHPPHGDVALQRAVARGVTGDGVLPAASDGPRPGTSDGSQRAWVVLSACSS